MDSLSRRRFMHAACAGTAGAVLSTGSSGAAPKPPRPNILWITAEDLSPRLGCYKDKTARTPNLDAFAGEGVLYENAFANVPVCAPARFTLITGMYASSVGCQHMRSRYGRPKEFRFYPAYLREAGYYCTNCSKTDYNTAGNWNGAWDQCGRKAHYKNRKDDQPFFAIFNLTTTHESTIHPDSKKTATDPAKVTLPPYHPDIADIRQDRAELYDSIHTMDGRVGRILAELEQNGLADSTIVFFYGDHGGILPRSKRFLFDTGTRVPLMIRFPKKYRHLAPAQAGGREDRPVSFVDFTPTLLSLAGVTIPDHMQGEPFLGPQKTDPREYVYLFRGRMDERYDMMRGVRGKRYLYIRNYMPHRIWGQHLNYLWKAQSTRAWEKAHREGTCNKIQSRFWGTKPPEELYDVKADPWTVKNLAGDTSKADILKRMRKANIEHLKAVRDTGFLPEGEMVRRAEAKGRTVFELVHDQSFPLEDAIQTAEMATCLDPACLGALIERMTHEDSAVRYWAATGCICLGKKAAKAVEPLKTLLADEAPDVRVAAGEALCVMGKKDLGLPAILGVLEKSAVGTARLHAINTLQSMKEGGAEAVAAARAAMKNAKDNYVKRAGGYYLSCFG